MKTHWYYVPFILLANAVTWVANLFKSKPKPKPQTSLSRWSDTVVSDAMAEAMDSTMGNNK